MPFQFPAPTTPAFQGLQGANPTNRSAYLNQQLGALGPDPGLPNGMVNNGGIPYGETSFETGALSTARDAQMSSDIAQGMNSDHNPGAYRPDPSWAIAANAMSGNKSRDFGGSLPVSSSITSNPSSTFNTQQGPFGAFGAGTGSVGDPDLPTSPPVRKTAPPIQGLQGAAPTPSY